ncbi:MAG: BatD family protein [Candidatus Celaenobacter polaris]|nr:BatD family protein [Candidatus Celaenobacter polaris]
MVKKIILYALFFLLITTVSFAENITVTSYVDKNTITLNELLYLTVEINSDMQIDAEPEIPQLTGFQIVGQSSSSSTSIEIINNEMSRSVTQSFTYSLRPLKTGSFTIPPIYTKFKDKTYRSKTINVNVVEANSNVPQSRQNTQKQNNSSSNNVRIFLQATPSKSEVFVGEPFTIKYVLYSNKGLVGLNAEKMPEFEGFVKEETFQAKNITHTLEVINGIRYYAYRISDYTLFPTNANSFTLDKMELLCAYEVPAKSFFDFGTTKRVYIQSNTLGIKVKPLSLAGQPQNFSGAVGQYSIKSELSSSQVKIGESVTLAITISGSGNIRMFEPPTLSVIPNIDTFPPEESDVLYHPDNVSGKKVIKYILIPEEPGTYDLPQISFTYFDPRSETYKAIYTKSLTLDVEKGKVTPGSLSYIRPQDIDIQGLDIHFIITKNTITDYTLIISQAWFWILIVLSFLSIVAALIINKEREKLLQDKAYYRARISNKHLQKDLGEVQAALKNDDISAFFVAADNALKNFIANKCNISAGASKIQDIIAELHKRELPEGFIDEIINFLKMTDNARFGGTQFSHEALEEKFKELNMILQNLSKIKFRKKR